MLYVWTKRFKFNKVVPIAEENWNEYSRNMYLRGYFVKKLPSKPPSDRTLRRWKQIGKAKSIAGNWINGLENDKAGNPSWLRVLQKSS